MKDEVIQLLQTIQRVATTPNLSGYDFTAALKEIAAMAQRGIELSKKS